MDWANILWFEVSSNLPNGETVLRKTCSEPCLLGGRIMYIKYGFLVEICSSENFRSLGY